MSKYDTINQNYSSGKNIYLSLNKKQRVIIKTPKSSQDDAGYIASLLVQKGYIPILQVLTEINKITQFTSCFKHYSIKHKKMKPLPETLLACLIGQGCNIGINRLANISVGVSEDILKNTMNWYFTLENIQAANNTIINLIDKLVLANAFQIRSG